MFPVRGLSALAFVCLTCWAAAQKINPDRLNLGAPNARSVTEMLAAEAHLPNQDLTFGERMNLPERDRSHLSQNPASPKTSVWPPSANGGKPQSVNGPEEESSTPTPAAHLGPVFSGTTSATESPHYYTPPDPAMAVGPDQVLVATNGQIKVFDKSGNLGPLNVDTNVFFGVSDSGAYYTREPRVKFDVLTGRWFVVMETTQSSDSEGKPVSNQILVACSNGPHISSSSVFSFYSFRVDFSGSNIDSTNFADYPTLGVDSSALYIGVNMYSRTKGAYGSTAFVVPKQALIAGSATVYALRGLVSSGTGPWAPQAVDNPTGGDQTNGYFIGTDFSSFGKLDLVTVSNPGTNPTGKLSFITVPTTDSPVSIASKGSSRPINAGDDRLLSACLSELQAGAVSLWTCQDIGVDSSGAVSSPTQDAVRWYQIDPVAGSLIQSGTFLNGSGASLIYPSIVMSLQGHAMIGFNYIDSSSYPAIVLGYRYASDPLGTFNARLRPFFSGQAYNDDFETTPSYRWGDYSATAVDPADGMSMWSVSEGVGASASFGTSWQTVVSKAFAPPPPPLVSLAVNQPPGSPIPAGMVAAGYTGPLTIIGNSTQPYGFFIPGSLLSPWDGGITFSWSAGAAFTTTGPHIVSADHTQLGATITIPTNSPPGAYALTVTNPDGQTASGATLSVVPDLASITVGSKEMLGPSTSFATVTLTQATPIDETIQISIPPSAPLHAPTSVVVKAGSSTGTFPISADFTSPAQAVTITAIDPGMVDKKTAVVAVETTLATSPWPKFHHDVCNTCQVAAPAAQGILKWKFSTGELYAGSPVIGDDGDIIVGAGTTLYALDPATGKLKWDYVTGGNISSDAPAIASDDTVYFGSDDCHLYALDGHTGKFKWRFQTHGSLGPGAPAIGMNGYIYFGGCDDQTLYCLDKNGNQIWTYQAIGSVMHCPAIGANGAVFFSWTTQVDDFGQVSDMGVVDGKTGGVIWIDSPVTSPVCPGGITLNSPAGELYSTLDYWDGFLLERSCATGQLGWAVGVLEIDTPSLSLPDQIVTCEGYGGASAYNTNGKVIFGAGDPTGYPGGDVSFASGIAYYGMPGGTMYAADIKASTNPWTYNVGIPILSTPAIDQNGTIYFGDIQGNIYAIR